MAINYPTSLDNFTNPNPQDSRVNPSHAQQHSDENDAIEALEAKVGINNSSNTGTHEFQINKIRTGVVGDIFRIHPSGMGQIRISGSWYSLAGIIQNSVPVLFISGGGTP